jgi:hypothetical protein
MHLTQINRETTADKIHTQKSIFFDCRTYINRELRYVCITRNSGGHGLFHR